MVEILSIGTPGPGDHSHRAHNGTGALLVDPQHDIDRIAEVPGCEVWVYRHTGYRCTIGASSLTAHGRTAVSIDDKFDKAEHAGLPIDRPVA